MLFRSLQPCGINPEEDIMASSAAGFTEHLTKPVDWPHLRDAIRRLLEKKAQETPDAIDAIVIS